MTKPCGDKYVTTVFNDVKSDPNRVVVATAGTMIVEIGVFWREFGVDVVADAWKYKFKYPVRTL